MRSSVTQSAIMMTLGMLGTYGTVGRSQGAAVSWLDEPTIASWNAPGQAIPAAPKVRDPVNPRCRELARPPQIEVIDSAQRE